MSMLDGVSQCWPLAKDCVVWWDAHSASAAWVSALIAIAALWVAGLGVTVTAASAWAVWRLGREANALARAPADASARERAREGVVILSALYAEFASIASIAGAWRQLVTEFGVDRLMDDDESRKGAADGLKQMEMPMTTMLLGRLHILPERQSATIASCLGLVLNLQKASEAMEVARRGVPFGRETIERLVAEVTALEEKADRMLRESGRVLYAGHEGAL